MGDSSAKCNMDHFLVFALLAVGFSAFVDAKSDEEACFSLMKNMKNMCCETMDAMKHEDDHKCKKDYKDWKCEDSKCMLDKRGLLKGEEVDEDKFSEMMAEWESKDPDVTPMKKGIENSCLGGQYKDFPPKDMCGATKFHMCVVISSMVECQKWKDTDECKGMPDDAKQCKSMMNNKE